MKLFSKFKIGKYTNTSSTKQGYLCGNSRNLSDGDDEEDEDSYTGCLNKSTPNKASSRTGSTQTLDKIATKQNGNMKPAMSMIDLSSKKQNSSKRKPIFRKENSKTEYDELPKEEKKDLKKRHKEDRLKRGYSWRQAYKTGAIPIEKVASKENFAKDLQAKEQSKNNLPKRGSKNDSYNSSYFSRFSFINIFSIKKNNNNFFQHYYSNYKKNIIKVIITIIIIILLNIINFFNTIPGN